MFRFFRKHRWLLYICLGIVAVTFVFFMGQGGNRNNSGAISDYGIVYGRKVTQQDYVNSRNVVYLFYWFRNGTWPDRANFSSEQLEQEIYINIMLDRKAQDMGIDVSEDAVAKQGALLLHQLDRNGQHVTPDIFAKQILAPEGLTLGDFEQLARRDIIVPQMIRTIALSGSLVTPREAQDLYEREHQRITSQAVFFLASNYLADVSATPAAVAQFYTNDMAAYRLPDRVQVSYIEFNLSNYLTGAETKLGKTNLDYETDGIFRQRGMDAVPDAKTPEEAKAKIREALIRQEADMEARKAANDFATEVFDKTPLSTENFMSLAKQKSLDVMTPKPFSAEFGPEETPMPATFVRASFGLSSEQPVSEPIAGPSGFYVIALDKQLPSEIPSFDSIRNKVASDYKMQMATQLAQRAGTNFVHQLTVQMAAGKTFDAASVAAGQHPETLSQFSLDTTELPELNDRVDFRQIKQMAFMTPTNHISGFQETPDGGFVLFVDKKLPVSAAVMAAQLPDYISQLRQTRESEAFNAWIQTEANKELSKTPLFKNQTAQK